MPSTRPRPARSLSTGLLAGAAMALLAFALPTSAEAAGPSVIENPSVDGPGICSETGRVGQIFTPDESGELTQFGFQILAPDGESGQGASATVSVDEWIDGDILPIVSTDNVPVLLSDDQPYTVFEPPQPIMLAAGSTYAIEFDFDGFDTCPVDFGPGAAYDGGDLLLDGEPAAESDLAFQLVLGGVGAEPDPGTDPNYVAPSISGTPPVATVGEPYSFQFTLAGSNNPKAAIQMGTMPSGLQLSEQGLLSGTPTAVDSQRLFLKAYDGVQANLLAVTITVQAPTAEPDPETAPVIEGTPPAAVVGQPYSYQFHLEGFPAPVASAIPGSLPRGLTLSEDGLLSGTPTQSGSFGLRLTATNGVFPNAEIRVQLVVNLAEVAAPAPTPPTAPTTTTTPVRAPVSATATRTLAKTGVEPAPALALAGAVLLAGGALAGSSLLWSRRRAAADAARR